MQHTFQGNFSSSSVFVLSWLFLELLLGVVCLLEKVCAGQWQLMDPCLTCPHPSQPATMIQQGEKVSEGIFSD